MYYIVGMNGMSSVSSSFPVCCHIHYTVCDLVNVPHSFGSDVKSWQEKMVPSTHENLQAVWQ